MPTEPKDPDPTEPRSESRPSEPDRLTLGDVTGDHQWPQEWNLEALLDRIANERRKR